MNGSPHIYIAVIDDDESFCRSMARLLRAADYQAVTYCSAEAFMADAKHPRFDCLLIDIELTGISGLELSRRLIAAGCTTPIVYVTAHDDATMRDKAEGTQCFGFVSKVEPSGMLLQVVSDALRSAPKDSRSMN